MTISIPIKWCLSNSCSFQFHFSQCSSWNTTQLCSICDWESCCQLNNLDLFLFAIWINSVILKSYHSFSMGTISTLTLNHFSVYLAICPVLKFMQAGTGLSSRTALYLAPSIFFSNQTTIMLHCGAMFSVLGLCQKNLCLPSGAFPIMSISKFQVAS